jgi:hypothetical protein
MPELDKFIVVFIDDILMYSNTEDNRWCLFRKFPPCLSSYSCLLRMDNQLEPES